MDYLHYFIKARNNGLEKWTWEVEVNQRTVTDKREYTSQVQALEGAIAFLNEHFLKPVLT